MTWSESDLPKFTVTKQLSQDLRAELILTPEPMLQHSTPHCVHLLSFLGNKPPSLLPLPEKSHYNHFFIMLYGACNHSFSSKLYFLVYHQQDGGASESSITAPIQSFECWSWVSVSLEPYTKFHRWCCRMREISFLILGVLYHQAVSPTEVIQYDHWMLTFFLF